MLKLCWCTDDNGEMAEGRSGEAVGEPSGQAGAPGALRAGPPAEGAEVPVPVEGAAHQAPDEGPAQEPAADVPGYFRFERPEVVEAVPKDARRVLEIGCAAGMTGAALKRRQECRVIGVERDPRAAAEAARRLDEVLEGDVEAMDLPFERSTFDAVICADVLEHLHEPERVLARLRELIVPGGTLVASIPNIANVGVIAGAAEGRFEYVDAGILDSGHLRFFTRGTFVAVLESAGFRVTRCVTLHEGTPPEVPVGPVGQVASLSVGRVTVRNLNPFEVMERHASQFLFTAVAARGAEGEGSNASLDGPGGRHQASRPSATVVVRVHDQAQELMGLLQSMASEDPGASYELVIVDEASSDGTRLVGSSPDGSVTVLRREGLGGLSGAWNLGATRARADVVVFVDPACRPEGGWLGALVDGLASDQSIGAMGPLLLSPRGTIHAAGLDVHPIETRGFRVVARRAGDMPGGVADSALEPVAALPGWCLAVRRDALETVGGFDEGYVDGEEDVDLSLRLREAGWRLACQPSARVQVPARGRGATENANANAMRLGARWGVRVASLPDPLAVGQARSPSRHLGAKPGLSAPSRRATDPAATEPAGTDGSAGTEGSGASPAEPFDELAAALVGALPEDSLSLLVVGSVGARSSVTMRLGERVMDRVTEAEAADVLRGGLPAGSFDAVACPGTFEEVSDPWSLAHALATLLAPGGRLVAWARNVGSLDLLADLADGRFSEGRSAPGGLRRLRHFTRPGLVSLLISAGLEIDPERGVSAIMDPEAGYDPSMPPNLVTTVVRRRLVISGVLQARMKDLAATHFVVSSTRPLNRSTLRGDATGSASSVGACAPRGTRATAGVPSARAGTLVAASGLDATIIVRVRDEAARLVQFVQSVSQVAAGATFDLVVADQGSRDGVAALRSSSEGHVTVLHLPSGTGQSAALNQAAGESRGRHLLFLDAGVRPLEGWLKALVDRLDVEPRLAGLCPLLLREDMSVVAAGFDLLFGDSDALSSDSNAAECTGPDFVAKARLSGAPSLDQRVLEPRHLQVLAGGVVAVRREAFEQEGGFDEAFVGDDAAVDLSLRLRSSGWRLGYEPSSQLIVSSDPQAMLAHRARVSRRRLLERWGGSAVRAAAVP